MLKRGLAAMKRLPIDFRLIMGIILAHFLLFFSYQDSSIFWYIFSASLLVLITFSILQEQVDDEASFMKYIVPGVISGLMLYFVFWLGDQTLRHFSQPFGDIVNKLYRWYAPSMFWQYLALILVAAPGEELFWRGFVQKRLLSYFNPLISVLISSLLYASVQIYSGSYLLVFAAFVSGVFWGYLYIWKKSMPLVIVSHVVFDIMMFIILPLR